MFYLHGNLPIANNVCIRLVCLLFLNNISFYISVQESAVLEGKVRPQFDRTDGRPEKVPLTTKTDVKLREKQKDFEQRDYQAQRVMNIRILGTNITMCFQCISFKFGVFILQNTVDVVD